MTEKEAINIAQQFIDNNEKKEFRFDLIGARKVKPDIGFWSVLFHVITPDGFQLDGPMVVEVNENTGKAEFFS